MAMQGGGTHDIRYYQFTTVSDHFTPSYDCNNVMEVEVNHERQTDQFSRKAEEAERHDSVQVPWRAYRMSETRLPGRVL